MAGRASIPVTLALLAGAVACDLADAPDDPPLQPATKAPIVAAAAKKPAADADATYKDALARGLLGSTP